MRAADLAKVAAQAEILRIQHMLKRQGIRAAFGVGALVFVLAALVLANVVGWQLTRFYVSAVYASLIMLGVNLAVAAIFGLLAVRSSPSSTEREALELRRRALLEARSSLALGALIPIAGKLVRTQRSRASSIPLWRPRK
jgi:hypothetical protein